MKKILMLCGILFVGLVFLTACGEDDNEIYFVSPFTGPDGENFDRMVEEFNATNPDFTVRSVRMAGDAMYSLINSAYPTGQGVPDLMAVHADFISNYIANDMLVNWDPFLVDFPEVNASNYLASAWDIGTGPNGERFTIPLDAHSWVLYYNRDLLEHYGMLHILDDGIITYDEIREVGEVVAAAGSDTATFMITGTWPHFFSMYKQLGGAFTDDGINPTLNNETAVEVFQTLRDLYLDGMTNENGEDAGQLFQTGQAIFFPEGVWWLNAANDIEGFEWGMTHTPQMNTTNVVNFTGSHQLVMFNSDERSDEKAEGIAVFIDWLRENSIEWARAGQNPASLAIVESAEFQGMQQSFLLQTELGRSSMVIDDYFFGGFVSSEVNRIYHDVVFGNISIEEGLESAQRALEDMIAQELANE